MIDLHSHATDPAVPHLMWHSAAPWDHSAFGQQTHLVTRRLRATGFRIEHSASGCSGEVQWGDARVLPAHALAGSEMVANAHLVFAGQRPRIVAFCDVVRIADTIPDGLDLTLWAPFHYDPPAPEMLDWLRAARPRIVALTEFGRERFAAADLDSVVIPHGVDLKVFRPATTAERRQHRLELGIPDDAFVVSIVGVNGDWRANRKCLPEMILAVAEFCRDHRDAVLYLHTDHDARLHGGIDLAPVCESVGFPPGRVVVTDRERYRLGVEPADVAAIYRASNVLLATSGGEGFGIPVIEAQACGIPVVVSDFTCQPELVGSGVVVGGQRRWFPPARSWLFTPSVRQIVAALEEIAQHGDQPDPAAHEFAAHYDIDAVARSWAQLLVSGEQR